MQATVQCLHMLVGTQVVSLLEIGVIGQADWKVLQTDFYSMRYTVQIQACSAANHTRSCRAFL